jgi:hypothetical protein
MAITSGAYSFLDVQCTFSGPGGSFDIASGQVSDDAIHIAMDGPKNTKTIGANGAGMHSLHASRGGKITVNLLKTAGGNAMLNQIYNYQQTSSAYWGQNIMTVTNNITGDAIVATNGAFVKQSDLGYHTEGGTNVWEFDFIEIDEVLGNGLNPTGLVMP